MFDVSFVTLLINYSNFFGDGVEKGTEVDTIMYVCTYEATFFFSDEENHTFEKGKRMLFRGGGGGANHCPV